MTAMRSSGPRANPMRERFYGDLSGQTFGRWLVLRRDPDRKDRRMWICRCTCGTVSIVRQSGLLGGTSKSCGCLHLETTTARMKSSNPRFKHGHARAGAHTKEYWVWMQMKKRCSDPAHDFYKDYGGRGIRVCDRWISSFENFLADMGPRPSSKHSIDRMD